MPTAAGRQTGASVAVACRDRLARAQGDRDAAAVALEAACARAEAAEEAAAIGADPVTAVENA